jgi:hypothetical protein
MRHWVDQNVGFGIGIVKAWRTSSDANIEERSRPQINRLLDANRSDAYA